MLLDPRDLNPRSVGEAVIDRLQPKWGSHAKREFLACQVEHASTVLHSLDEAKTTLADFRSDLAAAAAEQGAIAAGIGMPFDAPPAAELSPGARYERVRADVRGILDEHRVSGLHIHLSVPDRDHGAAVLNRMRGWLPLLVALSANSPFWRASDTGFASWRTIVMRRWTTQGCPPHVADAADYDRRIRALVGLGGTSDRALVAWNLRLSEHLPTVEFRAADAQLSCGDALAIAAVCRGLVRRASVDIDAGREPLPRAESELLDAAVWAAARDGHSAELPHPVTGSQASVPDAVAALVEYCGEFLDDGLGLLDELMARGSGAYRSRTALRSGSIGTLAAMMAAELTS